MFKLLILLIVVFYLSACNSESDKIVEKFYVGTVVNMHVVPTAWNSQYTCRIETTEGVFIVFTLASIKKVLMLM